MRSIRDGDCEWSVLAELDDRHRAHGTVEAVAEAADVDAEEGADRDADRRLVRHDQHVPTVVVRALDRLELARDALGQRDGGLPSRRWIPRRIRRPARVLDREPVGDFARTLAVPRTIVDLGEALPCLDG